MKLWMLLKAKLVDTQMVTPTLAQFGAEEISRESYWELLERLRDKKVNWGR